MPACPGSTSRPEIPPAVRSRTFGSDAGFRLGVFRILALLAAVVLAGPLACGDDDDQDPTQPEIRHPQDFLPQEIGGLTKDGALQVATNTTELQVIVDGGYQTYEQHGFRELAAQNYAGTVGGMATTLQAWIFDQGSADNATALHADENVNPGGCSDEAGIGDEARVCVGLLDQMMQFRRGAYWVRLVINNGTPNGRTVLDLFAQHVIAEIDEP